MRAGGPALTRLCPSAATDPSPLPKDPPCRRDRFLADTITTYSQMERSALVQHHGVSRQATVLAVRNHPYYDKTGGPYYTATVRFLLAPPIDGRSQVVVAYGGRLRWATASHHRVLLDPVDPSYAELPGAPAITISDLIKNIAADVFVAGVDGLVIWRAVRRARRHRHHARSPASLAPT